MPESITIDRHAIRFDATAAGWLLVLTWTDEDGKDQFHINNQLYTAEEAAKEAERVASQYRVIIKAVRPIGRGP
jgi:hypothetical protein